MCKCVVDRWEEKKWNSLSIMKRWDWSCQGGKEGDLRVERNSLLFVSNPAT